MTDGLNLRERPGMEYPIVGQVNGGEKYIFLGKEGEWIKIRLSENAEGWVFDGVCG